MEKTSLATVDQLNDRAEERMNNSDFARGFK